MQGKGNDIHIWRRRRHWLRNSLSCLAEAATWAACLYASAQAIGYQHGHWHSIIVLNLLFYIIAVQFIPANTFSRTARRDEVVACAMKTALIVSIIAAALFARHMLPAVTFAFFCVALTAERLIVNSWFVRYCTQPAHNEQGVLVCREEEAGWLQQALQQNTYGLKLSRMGSAGASDTQSSTAQRLAEYLSANRSTTSVYLSSSALPIAEVEALAHTCREQGVVLHLLPQPDNMMNPVTQSECRGTVCVLSPAKRPLRSTANRLVKRLTDIALSLAVLLTVFPPVVLVVFFFTKRQSHGPVLFWQNMCGMNGKTFRCITFRTRHYNAAPSFLDGSDDPGYFPFGKFLTRTRLEKLPQFLCVLRGSMTIVGSQAMTPNMHDGYQRELKRLFASGYRLKAGITSFQFPSQTEGSPAADVWYCRNWGFWLDVRIMLRRLATILSNSKAKSINYI